MKGKSPGHSRTFCALGAQQTVTAINGAAPIVYAGRTCTYRLYQGMSEYNGHQGIGRHGGGSVACTGMHNIPFPDTETTDTLENAIETAVTVKDAELYVVLSGCQSELIGEDTGAVVRRYRGRGYPLVYAEVAGFKGNAYRGHEWVAQAIIDQWVPPDNAAEPLRVNLWGIVPYLDPFWSGNLNALKTLLEGIGLKVNLLFGMHSSVGSWRKIPSAAVNLLVSPWVGLDLVRHLEKIFGTPCLHLPVVPIGALETAAFLTEIGERLNLDTRKVRRYISQREGEYYHYLERSAEFFLEFRESFPDRFFIVSDSTYSLALFRFLRNEMGLSPGCQFIVDEPPERCRAEIIRQFGVGTSVPPEVVFVDDSLEIKKRITRKSESCIPLVMGSMWDADMVNETGGCFFGVSTPLPDRLVLNRSYVGYDGALLLLEDLYGGILEQCG